MLSFWAKLPNIKSSLLIRISNSLQAILFLSLLCLLFGGLFSLLALSLASFIYDIPVAEIQSIFSDLENTRNIKAVKFLQLFNTLGLFIIPGLLFILLSARHHWNFLRIKSLGMVQNYAMAIVLFVVFMPFLNSCIALNAEMQLPEYLKGMEDWMRASEEQAEQLTLAFLKMDSFTDFLFNVFLIGILPALGEELIFRGILQRTISEGTRNHHLGIWLSAALFSAIHVQFFGFLPRLLLGAYFGYLFYYSANLWLPIFAHFVNNTSALVLVYVMGNERVEQEVDSIGASEGNSWIAWLSLGLFLALLWQFKKAQKNHLPLREDGFH